MTRFIYPSFPPCPQVVGQRRCGPLAHKQSGKGDVQGRPRHLLSIPAADLYNSSAPDAADLLQLNKFEPDQGLDQVRDFWEPHASCSELPKGKRGDASLNKKNNNSGRDYSEAWDSRAQHLSKYGDH